MPTLAFDKNGKPFTFARNTRKLLVRFFPNPGGRGTCVAVLDDDGDELYIDAEADYLELRKAVGNQPGLYRLDQCDEDGDEIDGVTAAYVYIGSPRNAAGPSDEVNALAIVRELASINAEVSKTMAASFAAVMEKTASILDSAAGAGILDRRLAAIAALDAQRTKGKHDEDDQEEDEDEDEDPDDEEESEPPRDPWAPFAPILKMVEPMLPQLGALLYAKIKELVSKNTTTPPAVAPNPAPAPTPAPMPPPSASPGQGTEPVSVTAGSSSMPQPQSSRPDTASSAPADPNAQASARPTAPTAPAAPTVPTSPTRPATTTASTSPPISIPAVSTPPIVSTAPTTAASFTTATAVEPRIMSPAAPAASATDSAPTAAPAEGEASPGEVRNAPPMPTPEQWTHLYMIRARLSPKEAAVAENAITRMSPDVLARWLAELSALSVDAAVRTIRSMISQLQPPRAPSQE